MLATLLVNCVKIYVCASQQHPAVGAVELQSAQYTEAQYTEGSGFYKWHTDGSWTESMGLAWPNLNRLGLWMPLGWWFPLQDGAPQL